MKIKTCPLCGSECKLVTFIPADYPTRDPNEPSAFWVRCDQKWTGSSETQCNIAGPHRSTPDTAIEVWDTRCEVANEIGND